MRSYVARWGGQISFAWLLLAGAALGGYLAVYLRTLPYPLVFDDISHILDNRAIRYLWHPRIFFESEYTRSRPFPYITFALTYALTGMSLSALRIWSLVLHLANAVLVGSLFQKWFGERGYSWGALAAGVLFLFHPLAVDTVVYLSARGSLMALFFLLLALHFHGRERQNAVSWLGFLACAFCAFLSRESAAALLPLLLWVHLLIRRRPLDLVPYLFPLLLGACVVAWLKLGYLQGAWKGFFNIQGEVDVRSFSDYARLSLSLWPAILQLLFFPSGQSIDHQISLPASWLQPSVLGGLGLWFAALFVFYLAWRNPRLIWLPVGWLFLSLTPTNTVFPLLDPLSERHLYLALPALAWGFGLCAEWWRGTAGRVAFVVLLLGVMAWGGTASLQRALVWRSPAGLWLDAFQKSPAKFRVAFNAMSLIEREREDPVLALQVFRSALQHLPPGALTYEEQDTGTDMAVAILKRLAASQGKNPSQLASEFFPDEGNFWREMLLLKAGMSEGGDWEGAWRKAKDRVGAPALSARARDPLWVQNSFRLLHAQVLAAQGKDALALQEFESVILPFGDTHFPYWTARVALGDLYLRAGAETKALRQYELAVYQYKVYKRFPAELHKRLYRAYEKQKDLVRAADALGEIVRVNPDDPVLRRAYAELLAATHSRHALRQFREADYYSRHAVSAQDAREFLRP
ncbi:MAG TPA: hypothetical protein VIH99_14185 [Bdellovibrionota bacterium]